MRSQTQAPPKHVQFAGISNLAPPATYQQWTNPSSGGPSPAPTQAWMQQPYSQNKKKRSKKHKKKKHKHDKKTHKSHRHHNHTPTHHYDQFQYSQNGAAKSIEIPPPPPMPTHVQAPMHPQTQVNNNGGNVDISALMMKLQAMENQLNTMQNQKPQLQETEPWPVQQVSHGQLQSQHGHKKSGSYSVSPQQQYVHTPAQQQGHMQTHTRTHTDAHGHYQTQQQTMLLTAENVNGRDERSTSIFTRASTIRTEEYTDESESGSGSDCDSNDNPDDCTSEDENDSKQEENNGNIPSLKKMMTSSNIQIKRSNGIDTSIKDVLAFWFPETFEATMDLWFSKSPTIDDTIRKKFGKLVIQAKDGYLDSWLDDVWSILALIILLDQFPRNMFRHNKQMYSGDLKAQNVVSYVLYNGYHHRISPLHCVSICLVLTHSESIILQKLCLRVWNDIRVFIPSDSPLAMFDGIFLKHFNVIKRFGRFPHRNEIFDRKNTKEEIAFLDDKAFRFDLPLKQDKDGKYKFEKTKSFAMAAFNDGLVIGSDEEDK